MVWSVVPKTMADRCTCHRNRITSVLSSRKIWRERIDWKVQLNVHNLYSYDNLVGIVVQPRGEVARMRLPPERHWSLSNTFGF
jgi:hypothetical protein